MISSGIARVGGILMLGVFAVNVYLGIYDTNLSQVPLHWDLNWVIAAVTLIAAILLLAKPLNAPLVTLAGIVWPIVYVASLAVDVYTKMCLGASYCWPSRTAAFQYLILNNPNAEGGGWKLFPYTIPIALGLLFVTFVLSIIVVASIYRSRAVTTTTRMQQTSAAKPP